MKTIHDARGHALEFRDCTFTDAESTALLTLSWEMRPNERWLITGNNGGGKAALAGYFSDSVEATPHEGGFVSNPFSRSTMVVSLEEAAILIEEERSLDDSDFTEGGVDPGRTPRKLLYAILPKEDRAHYPEGAGLEDHPAVKFAGINETLDRGVKYLSTGEIRRVLLCRALASKAELIVLDDPFEGLDAESRSRVTEGLERLLLSTSPRVIVMQDRYSLVPAAIEHVLELTNGVASFSGTRADFEVMVSARAAKERRESARRAAALSRELAHARAQRELMAENENAQNETKTSEITHSVTNPDALIEMKNVTVEWSGRKVLDNVSWILRAGEHWLIRGPNGSGKTTFLELISGDNPQCYRNEIYLFGRRRGTGESIWDIKKRLGIVSYRMHVEYRALSGLSLEEILLSGLHDSIGLYQHCGDAERGLARAWLSLAGFAGREHERFDRLSYGEQRAALIARAVIKCPPILILDEPCHGLDETARERVLGLLEAIGSGGVSTLLHVTHDPSEALPCERHVLELRPDESPMYSIGER